MDNDRNRSPLRSGAAGFAAWAPCPAGTAGGFSAGAEVQEEPAASTPSRTAPPTIRRPWFMTASDPTARLAATVRPSPTAGTESQPHPAPRGNTGRYFNL